MLHKPLLFLLRKPVETVKLRINLIVAKPDIMEQIVIEKRNARLFQLRRKNFVPVLLCPDKTCMELCRQCVTVPRMSGHQTFLCRILALKPTVHPSRIEVGKTPLQKNVHHLLRRFQINARRIVRIM